MADITEVISEHLTWWKNMRYCLQIYSHQKLWDDSESLREELSQILLYSFYRLENWFTVEIFACTAPAPLKNLLEMHIFKHHSSPPKWETLEGPTVKSVF